MLFLDPFPPRPAKTGPFIILLCLTPDDFTHQRRASGWERVKLCLPQLQHSSKFYMGLVLLLTAIFFIQFLLQKISKHVHWNCIFPCKYQIKIPLPPQQSVLVYI